MPATDGRSRELRKRARDAERALLRASGADPALERHLREELAAAQRALTAEVGALARAHIARLEYQDELDWRREKASEDEPMISEPVWHEHTQRR